MNRKEFIRLITLSPIITSMTLQELNAASSHFKNSPMMPILFIGHGSPMNAIEHNEFTAQWKKIAQNLPRPQAILCISAHWETKGTMVTAMENPKTIHDFGGFPKALFDVEYPAKGHPALAQNIQNIVTNEKIELDTQWGLDHGSWSVISVMYPKADIPVLQLSLDYTKNANSHFELAKQLKSLRKKGVLIIGSGNMVHNLRLLDWHNPNKGFDWAIEANDGLKKMITNEDYKNLLNIENVSKAYQLAIPTTDHYHPLLYIMGLKESNENITFFNDKTVMGSISMTSFIIQ
jgi:4,5-DOPA dioxygenase extradiol